ncbi:Sulfatase [Hexamita inflata]|uniref:Sulfatase n=1 Tax=Hexamita inflata TaxID=28002 RepID=A0AA86NW48_9EUKA|nr:Sulfatase [Hexamita inflata]
MSQVQSNQNEHQHHKYVSGKLYKQQNVTHSKLNLISFISLLFAAVARYFFVTLQITSIVYSKWNIIPHIVILAAENYTIWAIQQYLYTLMPKTFWSRAAISVVLIVLSLTHFFMSLLDIMFNFGLLMRFAGTVPSAYFLYLPPQMFDMTLPKEGQRFGGDLGKAFLSHCFEAHKQGLVLIISWIAIVFSLIALRALYVLSKRYFFKSPLKTQRNLKQPFNKAFVVIPTLILFVTYIFSFNGNILNDMVPAHWYFYRTTIRHQMPQQQYMKSVQNLRSKYPLPEGEEWLDQRETPIYPLVHAPKVFADAYNHKNNTDYKAAEEVQLPNVVFLLWESFTPAPKYLTDEVLLNEESVMNSQPYRKQYLPKLAELAETGHTFLGVRSNGIPTINGWHSLVSGEISSYQGVNMINSIQNSMDDFPSKFKKFGYHNLIMWPSNFSCDKKENFVYRGKKQMTGPDFLEKFPLWFDEIHQFYPTKEEADKMGIEEYPEVQTYWTNDRLSSQMFNYFFNERMKQSSQPIMGFYGNVDTHEDFEGFDDPSQYAQFHIGKGIQDIKSRSDVNLVHDAYSTVLKYSDAAFGRIVDNIKKNAPETIVVVVGDHASRQVPIYLNADKRINEESDIYFDMNCNGRSVGADQQFTTSAVISYFGSNQILKNKFDMINNKTTFEPSDHQDLIETVLKLIQSLNNEKLPSARLGVDLIQNAHSLVHNGQPKRTPKISVSHLNMEYSDERGLFRMNLNGKRDGYQVIKPLPSCIAGKNSINTHVEQQVYKDAKEMLELMTFLSENNRYFSYDFNDAECINKGTCEFPEPNEPFESHVVLAMFKKIMKISVKLVVLLYIFVTIADIIAGIISIISAFVRRTHKEEIQIIKSLVNIFFVKKSQSECTF